MKGAGQAALAGSDQEKMGLILAGPDSSAGETGQS